MPEIISRKEAIERGLKRYFTGIACIHGHVCERLIDRNCISCKIQRVSEWRKNNPEKTKGYSEKRYEKNHEIIKQQTRKYRLQNIEKVAEYRKKYQAVNKMRLAKKKKEYHEKVNDLIAVLRLEIPELLEELGL